MKREKFLHRPVISSFDILGKITGGQLVLTPVVSHALTTDPFAGARVVGTIATLLVDLDLAFHLSHSLGLARKIGAIGFGALRFTSGRPLALTNMTPVTFVSKCSLQILSTRRGLAHKPGPDFPVSFEQ